MSLQVRENSYLLGNFAPIASEDDFELTVQGQLPPSLSGVLYRNGPNPQFPPRDDNYHWFIGDGMIHAFALDAGRVTYRNRYVRTPKWQLEHAAGRALFGSWSNPATTDPSVIGRDGGVANTNILAHAGRLLALEEAHAPIEMQLGTLATRGSAAFGGRVTAHPKIDPATGEMIFFAYSDGSAPLSNRVSWGVVDAGGTLLRRESFDAPYCSMIHDFMVTENYVLIPVLPLTGDLTRAMNGGPVFAWEPEKPATIGVMRRDLGVASLRWFTADPSYVFHVMNAYEIDGTIVGDVMKYATPPLFPYADGRRGERSQAYLTCWTFDLSGSTDTVREHALDDSPGEFPRIDDRFAGLAYRHGWIAGMQERESAVIIADRVVHFDRQTGRRAMFILPEGDAVSEPVFVPDGADAAEGAGWLLAVVYRAPLDRSELIVLDARNVEAGPIATAQLPRRVPFGFHGNWVGNV